MLKGLVDLLFGLFVAWMIYVYYLFRFRCEITFDDSRLDPETTTGKLLTTVTGLIVGYVAKEGGEQLTILVQSTLTLLTNALRIHVRRVRAP